MFMPLAANGMGLAQVAMESSRIYIAELAGDKGRWGRSGGCTPTFFIWIGHGGAA
jgi:hypothetical protein